MPDIVIALAGLVSLYLFYNFLSENREDAWDMMRVTLTVMAVAFVIWFIVQLLG